MNTEINSNPKDISLKKFRKERERERENFIVSIVG